MMQVKGLSKDELQARNELVLALKERIKVVPDGVTTKTQPITGLESSSSNRKIIFDSMQGDYWMCMFCVQFLIIYQYFILITDLW